MEEGVKLVLAQIQTKVAFSRFRHVRKEGRVKRLPVHALGRLRKADSGARARKVA